MQRWLLLSLACLCACLPGTANAAAPGSEAHYYVASSSENQTPPVRRMRIAAGKVEKDAGKAWQWWEMTLEKQDGSAVGIKVLSEYVPLASSSGPVQAAQPPAGKVRRYIYATSGGECLEYVDQQTGRAVLPSIRSFTLDFLPHAAGEARSIGGFATCGRVIGHVLVRGNIRPDFPKLDFSRPKLLRLRSDLLIGAQWDGRDDRDESIPVGKRKASYLTDDEYREMIEAGANYFAPQPEAAKWLRLEPVYYRGQGVHPDDFYRSNYIANRMFIDEPGIRFGWNEWVPGSLVGPEVYANAIRMRVQESNRPQHREMKAENWLDTGTMEALVNRAPSWETHLMTAYYQLAGGVPGLIFEGRYVKRGYGWSPEILLGDGLEGLTDRQQYDMFNAFLRGAARRWGGYWGVSVYPEGDRAMMVPALARAYDQGARCLWFWGDENLPYRWRLQVIKGVSEHIRSHPRATPDVTIRSATAAVVLPPGYILNPDNGIMGVNREELSPGGASYSDIASAALFHGILLSRAGVEFDYVNDHIGLSQAGYRQLVYVRENGRVDFVPKRAAKAAPGNLKLALSPKSGPGIASRAAEQVDYTVPRATGVKVDGNLQDWASAEWIRMEGPDYLFGDNYKLETKLKVPDTAKADMPMDFLGFTWDQINPDYRKKYRLEGYHDNQVVVTSVKPGSAAAEAGLREGDIVLYMNEKWTRWAFEVWGIVHNHKMKPGATINLKIQRGGLDRYSGPEDLSASFALATDDAYLYLAADVADDVHQQTMRGPEFWRNDCIQIGFDPTLARSHDYGENAHEIGFALQDGRSIAWRGAGRRGQPVGEMKSVRTAIKRVGARTLYEAAVPLSELTPLSPGMWPQAGISFVVNDSDNGQWRKARLELRLGAMTAGKNLDRFPVFGFDAPGDPSKLSAAVMWDRRSLKVGGEAALTLAVASARTQKATVRARLESLDDPKTKAVAAEIPVSVSPKPVEHSLTVGTTSPPGRYRLTVEVVSPDGLVATRDSQPVYVYK